ncbi:MAG: glutaredoxin family protein [Acidobacteriaceae bacterium]
MSVVRHPPTVNGQLTRDGHHFFMIYPLNSMGTMKLVVYSASWCRDCREARRFLQDFHIPYTEIDIETTPGAAREVIAHTGKCAIPQFVIDGEWVQPYRPGKGFLYSEMKIRLGIDTFDTATTAEYASPKRG